MSSTTFNAISYANKLKEAGLAGKIADVEAEELSNIINSTLATKGDMELIKIEIKLLQHNLQAFIVKSLITTVGLFGTLQALLHLVKG